MADPTEADKAKARAWLHHQYQCAPPDEVDSLAQALADEREAMRESAAKVVDAAGFVSHLAERIRRLP